MLFKDIQGNAVVKQQLLRAVENDRLGHAVLFSGSEGDAKMQLALALATYLNCQNPHDGDACGECPSCRKMSKLAHPELHFMFPTGGAKRSTEASCSDYLEDWREFLLQTNGFGTLNDWYNAIALTSGQGIINANDCNNIIKSLSYTSYESRYKVVIVWMVEKLFYSAAPKLLKILEEPPEDTLFLLITENRGAILDTILSRTQMLAIPNFTRDDVKEILISKYNADIIRATEIAEISDGNVTVAINTLLSPEDDINFFDEFIQWMRICLQADMTKIISFVDTFSKNSREKILLFLRSSLSMLRQAMFYSETNILSVSIPEQQRVTFTKFAQFVTPTNIGIFDEAINNTIKGIERNGYAPLLMINLTIGLCRAFKMK